MRTAWFAFCLAGCLLATPAASHAGSDLEKTLAALARSDDAQERLAQVARLVSIQGTRAAGALARLVHHDPAIEVRLGAARALGIIKAKNALDLLVEGVQTGGPLRVRTTLAKALRRHKGATQALLARLKSKRTTLLERGLVLRALGVFDDDETREVLQSRATSKQPYLRGEAIRALVMRSDVKPGPFLVELLEKNQDADTLVTAIEAAEPVAGPDMRPALKRLETFLDPAIQEAATHLLERIRIAEALAKAKAEKPAPEPKDRYHDPKGEPGDGPNAEPVSRGRYDRVYVLDATGSTSTMMPFLRLRILREMDLLTEVGSSVRVGIIAYRGGRNAQQRARGLDILPLTFDLGRVRTFMGGLRPKGVDNRGASVATALHEALDRMGWRPGARRMVKLIADSGIDDRKAACATVAIHYRADRTRTHVAYLLRTRSKVPPELTDLARHGGTGAPDVFDDDTAGEPR